MQVEVSGGKVKVIADKDSLANFRHQKGMCKRVAGGKNVLIIGGGPASVACAETLRQEGFTGDVTIVTKDKYIPYDRIKLSKVRTASKTLKNRQCKKHISHMTSLVSGLEQRVEKSVSFDTCKITCDDTLLDKAYLFFEQIGRASCRERV